MDSDDITIIFAVYFIVFFALMYGVVSGFVSDIQHEIDSGMYTGQAVKALFLAQGSAVCIFVSVALMLASVIYLYFLITEI